MVGKCNTIAIDISCCVRLDYVCLWYYLIHVVWWLTHYRHTCSMMNECILKFNLTSCACLSCYLQKDLVSIVGSYCTLSLKSLVATFHWRSRQDFDRACRYKFYLKTIKKQSMVEEDTQGTRPKPPTVSSPRQVFWQRGVESVDFSF